MKFKKTIALLAAAALAGGIVTGCKGKETNPDEKVSLTWVFGGPGTLEDSDMVWGEYNKLLESYLPNTTVNFKCIPHADYAEKWRLMSAAREDVDIAWVGWQLNFIDEVAKGSYLDITELIDKYGQDMKKEFPDWLLGLTSVDGKIYAIPNYQMMTAPVGVLVPKEHVEKGWIDVDKASAVFTSNKVVTKEDYKIFEDYLKTVLENEKNPPRVSEQFLTRAIKWKVGLPAEGREVITCNAVIKQGDKSCKVYDLISDFPGNNDYYEIVNDWYNKGIIRKDILENPEETEGDEYLLWWCQMLKGAENSYASKYSRPMTPITLDSQDSLYIPYKGSNTNTAIAAQSKHPDRAMQLLNLMNSKKGAPLLNMATFGIEGKHYKKISENHIEFLGGSTIGSSNNKYGYENWALGNALDTYTTQYNFDGWNEYIDKEINKKAAPSCLTGFTLDTTPIKLEIAQYQAIMKEYEYLDAGTTPNYKEKLEERNKKLKDGGSDKIVEEVQRQVNEWLKNK